VRGQLADVFHVVLYVVVGVNVMAVVAAIGGAINQKDCN
jgi:hypothetical protein